MVRIREVVHTVFMHAGFLMSKQGAVAHACPKSCSVGARETAQRSEQDCDQFPPLPSPYFLQFKVAGP